MKRLIPASVILLSGCVAAVMPVTQRTLRHYSVSYMIGTEQARAAGEPMVVEENLIYQLATVAVSDYQIPPQLGSVYPAIRKGMEFTPYGELRNGDTLLKSEGLRPKGANGESVSWEYCVAVDRMGRAYGDAACTLGIVRKWTPEPGNIFEQKPVYREGSSRKELIYGGMSGNTIKVVYRESTGDKTAEAFQQELAYDLSQSNTIRFRKMEIEVRVATSNLIRFIVRSGMENGY